MRILFDGVNLDSSSGPNSFAAQLWKELKRQGHDCTCITPYEPDIQLVFIQSSIGRQTAPIVQRLDGIWHNTAQNWLQINQPIAAVHRAAAAVIVQSEFDRELVKRYIGPHDKTHVVPNGTNLAAVREKRKLTDSVMDQYEKVWCCAASWRPHKRLQANIEYFLANTDSDTCLVVAGENPDHIIEHDRVLYMGKVNRETLLRLYKRADTFIHLAYLDHCPNVVVDARAAGCDIICASSGGTHEIAGPGALIIQDEEWDFKPCKLYEPPELNFDAMRRNRDENHPSIDIANVALRYTKIFDEVLKG